MIRILRTLALATVLAASARAQAPAPAAPAGFSITVTGGIEGNSWWVGCLPLRIDLTGGASATGGVVRVRDQASHPQLVLEIPVGVAAGGRRTLNAEYCSPASLHAVEWSFEDGPWSSVGLVGYSGSEPFAVIVGENIGRLRPLDDALDFSQSRASRPDYDAGWSVVIPPDRVPTGTIAWSRASLVLVDSAALLRMPRESVLALRNRVLEGATVVVAGADPATLPRELSAALPAQAEPVQLGPDGASGPVVTALALQPVRGASRVAWAGIERPWAAALPLGEGRLVRLGLDLSQPDARAALDEAAWRDILALPPGSQIPMITEPDWVSQVQGAMAQRSRLTTAVSAVVPPMVAAVYLIVAAVGVVVGVRLLSGGNGPGASRRREAAWALLFAAIALPAFVAGLFRSRPQGESLTVAEYWEEHRVTRVVAWTPVTSEGKVPLPPADAYIPATVGGLDALFPDALIRCGAEPFVEASFVPRATALAVRSTSWREESPAVLGRLLAYGTQRLEAGGGDISAVTGAPGSDADASLLESVAAPFVRGKDRVLLVLEGGDNPTVWVIHRATP